MVDFFKKLQRYQFPQVLFLVFLLITLVLGYITGKLPGTKIPSIPCLKGLRQIRKDGLTISDLPKKYHKQLQITNNKWLEQQVRYNTKDVFFLLLTPNGPEDKPQVEWVDINGLIRWKIDSQKRIKFTSKIVQNSCGINNKEKQYSNIEARFFRGWTSKKTYAVMQWYAWPGGGSPDPGGWFWADSLAMASKKRVPWVAVSIMFPIEPLGDVEPYIPHLISIGEKIQVALTTEAFKE